MCALLRSGQLWRLDIHGLAKGRERYGEIDVCFATHVHAWQLDVHFVQRDLSFSRNLVDEGVFQTDEEVGRGFASRAR